MEGSKGAWTGRRSWDVTEACRVFVCVCSLACKGKGECKWQLLSEDLYACVRVSGKKLLFTLLDKRVMNIRPTSLPVKIIE